MQLKDATTSGLEGREMQIENILKKEGVGSRVREDLELESSRIKHELWKRKRIGEDYECSE